MRENLTNCVKRFQNGLMQKREFLKKINPIILKIPGYLGNKSPDIKHEFYAFILSKIDKIISSYKIIPNVNFTTWFNIVLKREFYYFISKLNKFKEFETFHLNETIKEYSINYQDTLLPVFDQNIYFKTLTEKEKDVVALKYGIKIYKRDISKSLNQILKKLDKKRNMETTLAKKYFKMIKLQSKISNTENINEKINLKTELVRIIFYKRKLEKALNNYSILPTNKWVGDQLGLSDNTISVYLNKIKKKLLKNSFIQA